MLEHTIMHEVPTFFHFHYQLIQPPSVFFISYHFVTSFLISFVISFIISFIRMSELYFMLARRSACQSYYIIHVIHISYHNVLMLLDIKIHITCTYHIISFISTVTKHISSMSSTYYILTYHIINISIHQI